MTLTALTDCDVPSPHVIVTSATGAMPVAASIFDSKAETSLADGAISPEASTARTRVPESVERELQAIFRDARYEVFEDGVNSDFGRRLEAAILSGGNAALLEINALLRDPKTSKNVAAECLRMLGRLKDRHTHAFRRWMLADLLNAKSILVRDGAVVGLSSLDDPAVLPSLYSALQKESSGEFRSDLDQLREQLENPERTYALSSAENP